MTVPRIGLLQAFAFTVFAFASAQALILWPAAAHLPLARSVAAAIVLLAVALGGRLARPFAAARIEAGGGAVLPSPAVRAAAWIAALATLACAAWLWVALWQLDWARPVYDWDGLYYHVPAMHGWAMAGRVLWIPGLADLPFANGYPMAVEALGFLVYRLTGTSRLLDAGNLFWWPLAALAVALIAARLGAAAPWRMAAGALIACVPGWVILSTTCYVDPGFAAAAAATLAALLVAADADEPAAARHALLFGAAGGLMIGAKGQGAAFFGVAMAAWILARALRPGRSARRIAALAALAVLAAFATGGYWMTRNVVWSGNPLFPIEWKLGAKVLAAGYDTPALLDGNMPAWLRSAPAWWRVPLAWTQPDAPIRGYAATGGLGWIWIGAGLPALVLAAWAARRRGRARALLLLAAVGAAWLAIQPAPWWARMTLWLHALGLPALALVLDALARARRPAVAFLAPLLMLIVLAAGFRESLGAYAAERSNGRAPDGGYRPALAALFPGMESECPEFFAAHRIARGPWSRFGTLLGGALAQPLDRRVIVPVGDADRARIAALRSSGVEWVVWDEVAAPVPRALRAAAVDSCAWAHGNDPRFLMLRIAAGR